MKNLRVMLALLCACAVVSPVFCQPAKESNAAVKSDVSEALPENVHAAVLNGSSGMCLAYMFENSQRIGDVPVQYEVCASPDVLLPKLLKGELDFGILPPNAAAKVYAKSPASIVVGAVSGQGMLSVITKDAAVSSLADLQGKTVYAAGQGATPEYMFRYLLAKNGIKPDEITLDFSIPASELAAALVSGKIEYALVPEPFATVAVSKNAAIRRAINVQNEWCALQNSAETYPMTVIVIRCAFAEQYPQFVRAFLAECDTSIEWTVANPKEAGSLVEKYTLGLKAPVASMAIPNCAFVYKGAADARSDIEKLLSVFLEYAPESIGGKLPDDGFYFK